MQHRLGDAAEQEAPYALPPLRTEDDQIGLARRLRDTTGRIAAFDPRHHGGEEISERDRGILHKAFGILFDLLVPLVVSSPEDVVAGMETWCPAE